MHRLVSGQWSDLLPSGVILFLLIVIGWALEPAFFTSTNFSNVMFAWSLYLPAAIGLWALMIFGKFDLSIGSIAALTSVIFAILATHENDALAAMALPAAIITPIVIGWCQAQLILRFRADMLITTLAIAGIAQSAALVLSHGRVVPGVPDYFSWFRAETVGLANLVLLGLAAIVTLFVLFERIVPFRRVYFVGQNPEGARALGAPVFAMQTLAFVFCAGGAALTGLLQSSRTGSASPLVNADLALVLITACVLGGSRLSGGFGNLIGVGFGLLTIVLLRNFVVIIDLEVYWQPMAVGMALIFGSLWHARNRS